MDTLRAVDVAELLGVSKQRAHQITRTDPKIPRPVETEPHRRWRRAEVERWADFHWWETRPWRRRDANQPMGR